MRIIGGELPFIATINAMVDNRTTYWDRFGIGI
jgi:hypothetical protein